VAKVLPVGLRDRDEIQRARDAAAAGTDPPGDYVTDFTTGAVSAFDWLLGLSAAPLSGMDTEITVRDIVHEEDLADEAIYRRPGAAAVRQGWAVGVQHALMWARGECDEPPVNIE
jgi:hypothetical protein